MFLEKVSTDVGMMPLHCEAQTTGASCAGTSHAVENPTLLASLACLGGWLLLEPTISYPFLPHLYPACKNSCRLFLSSFSVGVPVILPSVSETEPCRVQVKRVATSNHTYITHLEEQSHP